MEQLRLTPPKLTHESGDHYRAQRDRYHTSHQHADFRKSPLLYKQKQSGLIAEQTSDAYALGAAAHCLTLEGRKAFEEQYIVGGPINEKTGRCYGDETKAFRTWAAEQTKRVCSDDNYALACHINAAVHSHARAMELLACGEPEGVLRAKLCGVECQVRMDWFSPLRGIVDLKTCQDLDQFVEDCETYHYAWQMAFYRAVLNIAGGRDADDPYWPVYLIGAEKREPYRVGVWKISPLKLLIETGINAEALGDLTNCRAYDYWPTGYENERQLA